MVVNGVCSVAVTAKLAAATLVKCSLVSWPNSGGFVAFGKGRCGTLSWSITSCGLLVEFEWLWVPGMLVPHPSNPFSWSANKFINHTILYNKVS